MNTFETILTRRSVRAYQDKPVPAELIDKLLQAAMQAPSAGNAQPWHFVVVTDKKVLAEIPTVHPYGQMIANAPVAIVICADTSLEKHPGCWMLDCSAAAENLLLAAHDLSLGGVWTAVYPFEEVIKGIKKILSLPKGVIPHSVIPLGYPAHSYNPKSYYQKERIHRDKW